MMRQTFFESFHDTSGLTKRPCKEESEGRGYAARAAGPGPSERPGHTGRTAARVSAARSSSTRATTTSTSMFARGVAVWGAEKHFFNLKSASRGHFRSIPDERLSELQRIVFTKTTSAPSEERSATDFVKFVHSVSFYPTSTASYWNLPTNVQPASSQLPLATASS